MASYDNGEAAREAQLHAGCNIAAKVTGEAVRLAVDTGDVDLGWHLFAEIPFDYLGVALMALVDITRTECGIYPPPSITFVTPMFEDENGECMDASALEDEPGLLLASAVFSARLVGDRDEFLRIMQRMSADAALAEDVRVNAWSIAITTITAAHAGERVWWEVDERGYPL